MTAERQEKPDFEGMAAQVLPGGSELDRLYVRHALGKAFYQGATYGMNLIRKEFGLPTLPTPTADGRG